MELAARKKQSYSQTVSSGSEFHNWMAAGNRMCLFSQL